MFWSPTIGNTEVRGGVCMAISQGWIPSIIQKQVIIPGRDHYVIMQEGEIIWGCLNLYAPNTAFARQQFRRELLENLPPLDHWYVEYKCIMDVFTLSPWTAQVRAICVNSINGSFPKLVTI